MYDAAQRFRIAGTVVPRHQHPCAQADAVDEPGQQEDQTARRPDGRQRLAAQKVAHDEGVHRIVQLLEQVAEKNRHGEQQHPPHHAAAGQRNILFGHRHIHSSL